MNSMMEFGRKLLKPSTLRNNQYTLSHKHDNTSIWADLIKIKNIDLQGF